MRRVIWFLLAGVLVLAFAWFMAGLPGRFTAQFGNTTVEAATPVVAVAFLLLLVLLYVLYRVLAAVLGLPRRAGLWRSLRRRRAGDAAVSRALVALAAGDQADARREASRARNLLGDSAQTLLLVAEAGRLAGRDDEADGAFRALAQRPDAAFLGYRGLLRQAVARQDWQEATALARQAESVQPGAVWLRHERFRLAVHASHWTEALELADTDPPKAALAAAAAEAEPDPSRGLKLAQQAWKHDASLTPAALTYADRLRRDGREKRAQAVIRHTWTLAPHPDLAAFALAPVPEPLARVKAAQKLTEANPGHSESRLLLARIELNAGLTGEARHQAEAARDAGLNQRRLWLLLADIEEAEHGDTGSGSGSTTRSLAAGRRGRSGPGLAMHGLPHAAPRLGAGLPFLRRGGQPALDDARDAWRLPRAGTAGVVSGLRHVSDGPSEAVALRSSSWRAKARHPRLFSPARRKVVGGGPSPAMTSVLPEPALCCRGVGDAQTGGGLIQQAQDRGGLPLQRVALRHPVAVQPRTGGADQRHRLVHAGEQALGRPQPVGAGKIVHHRERAHRHRLADAHAEAFVHAGGEQHALVRVPCRHVRNLAVETHHASQAERRDQPLQVAQRAQIGERAGDVHAEARLSAWRSRCAICSSSIGFFFGSRWPTQPMRNRSGAPGAKRARSMPFGMMLIGTASAIAGKRASSTSAMSSPTRIRRCTCDQSTRAGKIGLQRLDRVQPQHAGLAAQHAGPRGPDRVVPAPFQPDDVGSGEFGGQRVAGRHRDQARVVVPRERGQQRGKERLPRPLHAIGQEQARHGASPSDERRAAYALRVAEG